MYQYYSAIGFSEYNTRAKIHQLALEVINQPDRVSKTEINDQEYQCVYEKDYGEAFGILVSQIVDHSGYQEIDYVMPYVRGMNFLYSDHMRFEKASLEESFQCICDDNSIGILVIFKVINTIDYTILDNGRKNFGEGINCATIAGIASSGKIILPIQRDPYDIKQERENRKHRNHMIEAAKNGDVEAMEHLTIDDFDTYNKVASLSKKKDVYSIVTSSFMPDTVESDKYSVLGIIKDYQIMKNKKTEEVSYYISLS